VDSARKPSSSDKVCGAVVMVVVVLVIVVLVVLALVLLV
jgi:hypothetical protein